MSDESTPTIHLLDDALVDQIAAGEVVERPASVVKELVENALDAAATRIRVEVRDGGASWIGVTDDGHGMTPDDAKRALERHATSKIRSSTDLERIHSFGFRGEALPAIASVSRLRLRTRPHDADEGFEIRVDGGRIVEARRAGGPAGTGVEVADLFSHVPARRKFLKKASTEWGHIADWLTRSALALPGIHFEVRRDDRPALVWPAATDPLDRVAALLSEDEAASLMAVERQDDAGLLRGFVSSPERTRANTHGLFLFVNGRPVRDPLMRSTVLQAYRDWLPRGRFPTAILFLDVPPDRVDVNVHPAKWEVRFSDAPSVRALIRRALRDSVAGRQWLGGPGPAAARFVAPTAGSEPGGEAGRAAFGDRVAEPGATDWIFAERGLPAPAGGAVSPSSPGEPLRAAASDRLRFGDLRLVGQLMASYLLVEGKGGLLLVDQHAAHERVLYERLRAEWLERGVERQGLLVPATVELGPRAAAALRSSPEVVSRLGFEIDAFGEDAVVVRAVPALLAGRDPGALVRELAEELEGEESDVGDDAVRMLRAADRAFATLACHGARRFGDHLERDEQRAILDSLDAIPWAPTCPHGRPVAVAFERGEIERRFGRK